MANHCIFEMRIRGEEGKVNNLIEKIKSDCETYNNTLKDDSHVVFRFFSVDKYENKEYIDEQGCLVSTLYGCCAWSLFGSIFKNSYSKETIEITYAEEEVLALSKKWDLDIEMFSEETGLDVYEHYLIQKGKVVIDEDFMEQSDKSWNFSF